MSSMALFYKIVVLFILAFHYESMHIRNYRSKRLNQVNKWIKAIELITFSTIITSVSISNPNKVLAAEDSSLFYEKYPYIQPSDILTYLNDCNIKEGDIQKVITSLNTFAEYYPMYKLSDIKAQILKDAVSKARPKHILELGSFFGFSALNIASVLPKGSLITCVEGNIENYKVAQSVFKLGLGPLSDTIHIVNGISTNVILNSPSSLFPYSGSVADSSKQQFDFIFMDHDKDCYLKDLQLLEASGLLSDTCTIVADNVVFPGAPGYLDYVRYNPSRTSTTQVRPVEQQEQALVGKEGVVEEERGSILYDYNTIIKDAPFERVGFETQYKIVPDGMSVTYGVKKKQES